MEFGYKFDTGVIYLPPSAVSQAVSELVMYNADLKKDCSCYRKKYQLKIQEISDIFAKKQVWM